MFRNAIIFAVLFISCAFGQQVNLGPCTGNSCQVQGILGTNNGGCGNTLGCGAAAAVFPIVISGGNISAQTANMVNIVQGFPNAFGVCGGGFCNSYYLGDFDQSTNTGVGITYIRGADQTAGAGSSSAAGEIYIRGGNDAAASGGFGGSVLISAGANTGGANQGILSAAQTYTWSTTSPTQWYLQCPSNTGAKTAADCGSLPGNWIGISESVSSRSEAVIVPPFETPIASSNNAVLGHTVCAGSTPGKVTDSGGIVPCTPAQGITVGIVEDIGGAVYALGDGVTFTTSVNLPLVTMNTATLAGSTASGSVQSVGATAPVASSGGVNPVVSLNNSTVTPGSYTNANLTIDAHGLVQAASNGGGSGISNINGPITLLNWTIGGGTATANLQNQGPDSLLIGSPIGVQTPFVQQSKSCVVTSTPANFNCTFDNAVAAGSIIIAQYVTYDGVGPNFGNITWSTGETPVPINSDGGGFGNWYSANSVGGTTTAQFSNSADASHGTLITLVEVKNILTSGVLDTVTSTGFNPSCATFGSGQTGSIQTITTTVNNDIVLWMYNMWNESTFIGAVPPFQIAVNANQSSSAPSSTAVGYTILPVAGPITTFATMPSGNCGPGRASIAIAFKPLTSGSSNQPQWNFMPFSELTHLAFPGLIGLVPSSTVGDTQIDLHVGSPINAQATTSSYAGNDAASTLYTVPALVGNGESFHCYIYVSCHTSVATATITPALLWTDESNTSDTLNGSVATCTTLGTNSFSSQSWPIRAKSGSTIYFKTTLANSPNYDVHAECSIASNN